MAGATCRYTGTGNCDGDAAVFAEGDIVFGSGGNLFECVNAAGCAHDVAPTGVSTDWEALLGGDTTAALSATSSRMEITSDKVEIYNNGVLRVVLGNLS